VIPRFPAAHKTLGLLYALVRVRLRTLHSMRFSEQV
jgi:hypothetical protein